MICFICKKGPEWNYVNVVADGGDKGLAYTTMHCLFCGRTYNGGPNRIRAHLLGGETSISKCEQVPDEVMSVMRALNDEKQKRDREKQRKIELDKLTKSTGSCHNHKPLQQTSIAASFNSGFKEAADVAVARLFYGNGIPFSIIEILQGSIFGCRKMRSKL
jgi:hypothetical protein